MNTPRRPALLERIAALLLRQPLDREQLRVLLRGAYQRNLIDAEALSIIEGAMTVSEMQVREIMIPRAQMDVIDINEPIETFIPIVMSTAHSRFPVIDQNRDDVIGVLLAKDLLRHYAGEEAFNVREMLRPAVFVPESKRLNVLLREFRASRNHMAIVVDEYGGTAGIMTIEDIVEELFGEIEDEHDSEEIRIEQEIEAGIFLFSARLDVEYINQTYKLNIPESDSYGTLGGFIVDYTKEIPQKGNKINTGNYNFVIEEASNNKIELVKMSIID
jgi:magnesium and cobalt transporter